MILSSTPLTKFPVEIWHTIATMVLRDLGASHLIQFMLACRTTNIIGQPVLYREVRLGGKTDFANFKASIELIIAEKSPLIFEIEVPDTFRGRIGREDTALGRLLMERLVNLKQLSVVSGSSASRHRMAYRNNHQMSRSTFWRPEMFMNVAFKLERIIGAFSELASFQSLLANQPHIRSWMILSHHIPRLTQEWHPPSLQTLCFSVTSSSTPDVVCTMPLRNAAFRSGITRITIRGIVRSTIFEVLSSFENLGSLSISTCWKSELSDCDMLARIWASVPTLSHLVLRTSGGKVANPPPFLEHSPKVPPHCHLDVMQMPKMPGLKSLVIVVRYGQIPRLSVEDAQIVMDKCQQLLRLDIIHESVICSDQAFRRSNEGDAYVSQDILCIPRSQDVWF